MNRKFHMLTLAGAGLAVLVGCATKVPMIEYHEGTYQMKVQALQHWDLMAKEIAAATFGFPGFGEKSITLAGGANSTEFLQALNGMIKSELVNRSMRVLDTPDAALTLTVETQLVRHGRRYYRNPTTLLGALGYAGIHIFSGREVGLSRNAKSELLVLSVVREGGIPKMAVKQMVYVSADEDSLYNTPLYNTTAARPVSTIKVTR
jgi:hypothetical protein